MTTLHQYSGAILAVSLIVPAAADIIYSDLQNIAIPTDFAGVTVTVAGGTINPFFGGAGVANNPAFQPARSGTDSLDTILNLAVGSTVDVAASGLHFATLDGGSMDHLGITFTAGQEGYLGFKINNVNYGWMRVVFTSNAAGAVIKDWAYDNTANTPVVVGRIQQGNATGGTQTVMLTPAGGESFVLGSQISNTGGNVNSVVKTGAGSTTLTGTNTYTGTTTISAGTLSINGSTNPGSGAVTVSNTGTRLMGTGTVGGSTTIGTGAILAPGHSVGTEGFSNNLTLGTGSIFEWELAATPAESGRGANYDAVNVAGALGGGGAIFRVVLNDSQNFGAAFWDTNRTWTDIFKSSDSGGNLSYASIFSSVQYYNSSGDLGTPTGQGYFTLGGATLSWTAVPEPTTALIGLLLGAGLLRRTNQRVITIRHRRRRNA